MERAIKRIEAREKTISQHHANSNFDEAEEEIERLKKSQKVYSKREKRSDELEQWLLTFPK